MEETSCWSAMETKKWTACLNQENEASTCSKRQYAGLSGIPRFSLARQQSRTFWPSGGMNPGFAKVTVSTQVLLQSLCYRSSMTSMVWLWSIYRKRKTYERHWTTFVNTTPEKLDSSLQTPSPTNHAWKIQVRYPVSWLDLAAMCRLNEQNIFCMAHSGNNLPIFRAQLLGHLSRRICFYLEKRFRATLHAHGRGLGAYVLISPWQHQNPSEITPSTVPNY